ADSPAMTRAGSPGIRRTMEKTIVATPNSVGIATTSRRARYLATALVSPSYGLLGLRVDRIHDRIGRDLDVQHLRRHDRRKSLLPQEDERRVAPDLLLDGAVVVRRLLRA